MIIDRKGFDITVSDSIFEKYIEALTIVFKGEICDAIELGVETVI